MATRTSEARAGRGRGAASAVVLLAVILAPGCASSQAHQSSASAALPWERAINGAFENKGVATIERLGPAWVLTVQCAGTHTTYLEATSIDLAKYDATYVRARYRWVDRLVKDPRCVLPPCQNISQRMIALDRVDTLAITRQQADVIAAACKSP